MSRLEIDSPKRAKIVMEGLYKDLERRIESSPPGLCPVDMARAFLELCHAQTCGKCVPCRIGLGQLNRLIKDVLDGKGNNGNFGCYGGDSPVCHGDGGLCHRI